MKQFFFVWILFLALFSFNNKQEKICRFNQSGLIEQTATIVPHVIEFQDTIPNDTLFEYSDINQIPLYYSRRILTGVCVDGKCRMVNINLYWHVTGRYLGFKLAAGEFLSKTEHHPFMPGEYERLHSLLADPLSPLSQYSIDELVPKKDSLNQDSTKRIDAVSSATIAAVLNYIVKGAVYTTYTLWHIVYGQTRREVELLTSENLSSPLIYRLLESESLDDQVWALNHISEKIKLTSEIKNKLFEFISGDDIYLAERALNAIQPSTLSNKIIQIELAKTFETAGFLRKRLILQKLKEAPVLHNEVIEIFTSQLTQLNGSLVKSMIELLLQFHIENEQIVAEVQILLKNENRYIASQALKYVEAMDNADNKTKRNIRKYKKKNNLQ